jgi:hypothetical protein
VSDENQIQPEDPLVIAEAEAETAAQTEPVESQAPDAPASFTCGICEKSFPADQVYDTGGTYTCRSCYAERLAAQATAVPAAAGHTHLPHHVPDAAATHVGLRASLVCPHCWHRFAPEEVLWIAEHTDLLGDVILGPEAQARFLPSRFTPDGAALDARGMRCQNLACPHCHLSLPRVLLEADPLFISIIGVPASGKSYLLATMAWQLRRLLPREFGISFTDADTLSNQSLLEYEETLFHQNDPDKLVAIRKTELQGELYDQIRLNQQVVTLPRPFLFSLRLTEEHPGFGRDAAHRLICLYDNAGEHFQPGMDNSSSPVTHHLERSRVLMFLYDPTQDPRFAEKCRAFSNDPQLQVASRTQRQGTVLTETALRVRRLTNLAPDQKHHRPLLVILPKSDVWSPLVDADLVSEPLFRNVVASNTRPNHFSAVDVLRIEATSHKLRDMLLEYAPQLVAAAEDFCTHVVYMPVSALGRAPEVQPQTGMLGVRPRHLRPRWVTMPVLYTLSRWATGLVAGNQYPAKAATT